MQVRLLLPLGTHALDPDRAGQVSRGLLLRPRDLHSPQLHLRLQVPGGVVRSDQVPAALLLPEPARHQPDPVPDRLQVRQAGSLRADPLPAGNLRDVRGEGVLQLLRQGEVLPDGDDDGAVPGGVLLPGRGVCADAVSREPVLPHRVGAARRLPAGDIVVGGVRLRVAVHVRGSHKGLVMSSKCKLHCYYNDYVLLVTFAGNVSPCLRGLRDRERNKFGLVLRLAAGRRSAPILLKVGLEPARPR